MVYKVPINKVNIRLTIDASIVPNIGREKIRDGNRYANNQNKNISNAEIGKEVVGILSKLALDGEHENDNRVGEYAKEEREREENGKDDRQGRNGPVFDARYEKLALVQRLLFELIRH